jgi:hypothetical protein
MNRLLPLFLILIALSAVASAQVKQTDNTFKLADGQRGERASITDMGWLAGTWAGEAFGGETEEVWSRPKGGIMMGMFRLTKAEKPEFYELMTLGESDGTLVLRLKHFSADFTGWEEKDKTVDFRYIKKDGKRFLFEGMTFEPVGDDTVNVYVAIGQKDGKAQEALFKYSWVK